MWHPTLRGFIDRRVLVNFRIDPEVMSKWLPAPFRPKIVNGYAMAGICLIRMNRIGPKFLPYAIVGSSENGALRFAVEWEQEGRQCQGVYIPARYTTSRLAAWAGTRYFPGRHYRAQFQVQETPERFQIAFQSPHLNMTVDARVANAFAGSKVFSSLEEASAFFRGGADGYSESLQPGKFDGVELRVFDWKVSPLTVEQVTCDFFSDVTRFPSGTAEFDNALLMRGLRNEFHNLRSFCCMVPTREQAQVPVVTGR
jgi:hypothetical protein